MALAGLDFDELARAVDKPGMGSRNLRYMADEHSDRQALPHELRYIAEACGLDAGFFTVDLTTLGALEVDAENRRLDELEQHFNELREEMQRNQARHSAALELLEQQLPELARELPPDRTQVPADGAVADHRGR